MVGTQVGNYLIEELLGEGGMGTVYRALETQLDRRVAIKVLHADLARNPTIVERFRAEARAQANLIHPNVALLYAFMVHQGSAMMVMEYIDGQNIHDIVKHNGPLHVQHAIPWCKQALAGIGAAHRLGIVHRDIKPSNLILTRAGVVKVLDFGIAKLTGAGRSMTSTGGKLGTVFYMSPEQIQAGPIDNRSDIYSLGVTLFEMLTGRVPFDAASDFKVQKDHVQTPPPLPTAFSPSIPRGLEKIVLKALEKNPAERFQSVEEFSAALDNPAAWEGYVPTFARGPVQSRAHMAMGSGYPGVNPPPAQPLRPGTVVDPPRQHFGAVPPRQPYVSTVPPPGAGDKKAFWSNKRNVLIVAGVAAALILAILLFSGSGKQPVASEPGQPQNQPGQPQNQPGQPQNQPGQPQNPPGQPQNPPNPPPADPSALKVQALNGVWTGDYRCLKLRNTMVLRIRATSLNDIAAQFEFPAGNLGTTISEMAGTLGPDNNSLDLKFQRFISNPMNAGHGTNLKGAVDFDTHTISGKVLEFGCSDFQVRKQ